MVYPAPPANDDFARASVLVRFADDAQGALSGATTEVSDPGAPGASVWFAWRAPADGVVTLAVSGYSLAVEVYSGAYLAALLLVVSDTNNTLHQLEFRAHAGRDYRIALRALENTYARYDLRLLLVPDRAGMLRVLEVRSDASVRLGATGFPGAPALVEVSSNLIDWTPLQTGGGTEFEVTDPSASGPPRFYRVVSWP